MTTLGQQLQKVIQVKRNFAAKAIFHQLQALLTL